MDAFVVLKWTSYCWQRSWRVSRALLLHRIWTLVLCVLSLLTGKKRVILSSDTKRDGDDSSSSASPETVESLLLPPEAPMLPVATPSKIWSIFELVCESRPVATAWAALPYRYELLLFAIAAAVRFYDIRHPESVIFDEYYFGRFTNHYNEGSFYFDIHPPLGKLTMFAIGWLFNYNATVCKYENIHDAYAPGCNFYILRYISGVCGAVSFHRGRAMGRL